MMIRQLKTTLYRENLEAICSKIILRIWNNLCITVASYVKNRVKTKFVISLFERFQMYIFFSNGLEFENYL